MEIVVLLCCLFSILSREVFCLHIFKLNYRVTPEPSLTSPDYDGIVFVSSLPINCSSIPEPIREALSKASKSDEAQEKEGSILDISLPAGRLIYAPTGPISEFHEVRTFGETAKKAIERALKANVQAPLLVLSADERFPHAELVTLLGCLDALYVNIQYREEFPDKSSKVKNLGVWGSEYSTVIDIVNIAANFEDGRIVTRDISDTNVERMSPQRIEEYVREVFPPGSGVNISVVSDPEVLKKEYPLFAAFNGGASGTSSGRIIYLTYQTGAPVEQTLLLVGNGATYNTGRTDITSTASGGKVGAAVVAGFMKTLSDTRVGGLKVVAAMILTGSSNVADEVIQARSGKKISIVKEDAEYSMAMADVICYMKELVEKKEAPVDPHIVSIATTAEQADHSIGQGYSIVTDNGPAAKIEEAQFLKLNGEKIGEPMEVRILWNEDFESQKGKAGGVDMVLHKASDHPSPASFLILASGLEKHRLDSPQPIKYSHLDVVGKGSTPLLAVANRFILRLEDPALPGVH